MTDLAAATSLAIGYSTSEGRLHKHISVGEATVTTSRPLREEPVDPAACWSKGFLLGDPITQLNPANQGVNTAELFCGSGGLGIGVREVSRELGLRYSSLACLDHDSEAVDVYAANHGSPVKSACSATEIVDYNVAGQGDGAEFLYEPEILDPNWEQLRGRVDVLMAGPPCQGHSNLNNRSRRTDKRNQLYLTVPAAAIALDVEAVIIENVQAVVHDRTEVVGTTVRLLEQAGYYVETGTISALDCGWPQTRKRFFVIARRGRSPIPLAEARAAAHAAQRDLAWAISDVGQREVSDDLHVSVDLSEENRRRIDYLFDNDLFDLPNSERPDCHKGGTTYGAVYGRLRKDRPAPTITTGFLTPGRGRYIHPTERRTLTPREAARIQGFPDDYNFAPNPRTPPGKSKLTKWIGDAVPMPLGYVAGLSALAPLALAPRCS